MQQEQVQGVITGLKVQAGGLSSGAILWQWLGENHASIGSVCMILGLLITASGFSYSIWKGTKRHFDKGEDSDRFFR